MQRQESPPGVLTRGVAELFVDPRADGEVEGLRKGGRRGNREGLCPSCSSNFLFLLAANSSSHKDYFTMIKIKLLNEAVEASTPKEPLPP
jgi:hypothetical protein